MPERWKVKLVFIETPHGPAINWTSLLGPIFFGMSRHAQSFDVQDNIDTSYDSIAKIEQDYVTGIVVLNPSLA